MEMVNAEQALHNEIFVVEPEHYNIGGVVAPKTVKIQVCVARPTAVSFADFESLTPSAIPVRENLAR